MQAVDKFGAADYLGLTLPALNRRIASGKFPSPDYHNSSNSAAVDWWTVETLDKYRRSQARKTRKRTTSK